MRFGLALRELSQFQRALDVHLVRRHRRDSGIIRRHPDVRWLRQARDVDTLIPAQRELLAKGWSKVRPGGFLAWSVCSVFSDEGERLIEGAGLSGPVLRSWLLSPQLEPHGDGFWAALIQKP